MKKVLWWIILFATVIGLGILFFVNREKSEPAVESTFNEYLIEDHAYSKTFSTSEYDSRFYEVQTVLNGNLDTLRAEDVRVISSTTVFTAYDTVYFLTRSYDKPEDLVLEYKIGMWLGSENLDSLDIRVSFKDAVKKVYENGKVPAGDKMTFRQPITGVSQHPLYCFGTDDSFFVFVDSYTGEIEVDE